MILERLEGIAGFMWGAWIDPRGVVQLSAKAPADSQSRLELIGRLLQRTSLGMKRAELRFEHGRVMAYHGSFGQTIVFCRDHTKSSLIEIILADIWENYSHQPRPHRQAGSSSNGAGTSDSMMRAVHSISLSEKLVQPYIVEELIDIFTQFLGPLAPMLAKKQAKKNELLLDKLSEREWTPFINLLAELIQDPKKRDAFLDQAVLLKMKF